MNLNNLTREEAIALVGLMNVEAVENDDCEPTNRVYDHEDGEIEWMAGIKISDYQDLPLGNLLMANELPIDGCYLKVYYYTDAKDAETVESVGGDWGYIDWKPHHYAIA